LGLWKESAEDAGKAIALGEAGFEVQEGRGQALAELGRWAEAADAFAEAAGLRPDAIEPLYPLVTCQLGAGRHEDYRRDCAGMMQRARAVGSLMVKEVALYRCIWAPRGVLDFPKLLRLADLDDKSSLHPRIRGPLLYRLDRPDEAIGLLDEATARFPRRAWDWLFVAMTQQRLGRLAEARQALARAVRWVEVADQGAKAPDGSRWYDWRERIEVQFLLEEARGMVEPGPSTH
jgi:tetratricopeptide (TPR) repeat protein